MELKVNRPALAGQDIDPDAFQRVWNRVMPGEPSPRAESSTAIPPTARPAEPSVPAQEVPTCPADTSPDLPQVPVCGNTPSDLPQVPDCPADTTPDLPAVPDCPSMPECPSCPECPPCPDCPNCPEQPVPPSLPEIPALCLGEASQGDSQQLEELMSLAQTGAAATRALARRASGSYAKTLASLAADHRLAFRRLSAAYFLITGRRYTPKCAPISLPPSLALALRQQFVWEQRWEQVNSQAAQATADPCLEALYSELAQEGALHAGVIRSILEQMA